MGTLFPELFPIFTIAGFGSANGQHSPKSDRTEKIRSQVDAGNLAYRLTEPSEVEALLGPAEKETEKRDGGMLILTYTYSDAEAIFGKFRDDPNLYTLRRLVLGEEIVDIGQNAKLRLRSKDDLAKLDRFGGFQNISLTCLDLRDQSELVANMPFDSLTEWPPASRMPSGFDPERLLHEARGPGLGVGRLHSQGIDGRGVGIAVIDQPLLLGHREYASRFVRYDATGLADTPPQMHGSPVACIAVGETTGVAPAAELSYFAVPMWKSDNRPYAEALDTIVGLNTRLPPNQRIRTVSISTGAFRSRANKELWLNALERAEGNGIFVATCDPEFLRYGILSRVPYSDGDDPSSYVASRYVPDNAVLLVPGANRTLASHRGIDFYWFCPSGGMSWGAPYLAGLAALAYQVNPAITPMAIRSLLVETATKTDAGAIVNPEGYIDQVRSLLKGSRITGKENPGSSDLSEGWS
jgi:subtilisin family serine protease